MSTSTKVRSPRWSTVSIASRVVPGHLGDDHALLAEQRVQQARLADVRPAEDRDADRLLADLLRPAAREHRHDRVEQVAGAVAVQGRERHRVAEPEPVELERERVLRRVVDLVREQEHRLVRAAQDRGELLVAGRDPGARVDDEQDRSASAIAARACSAIERVIGVWSAMSTPPVSISRKRWPFQSQTTSLRSRVTPGRLVHDGGARLGQPVDERRLAHVREADDRDGAEQRLGRAHRPGGGSFARRVHALPWMQSCVL